MNRLSIIAPLLCLAAAALPGQTPFSFRSQVSGTVQTLGDNGSITFSAEAIGRQLDGTVQVTNTGTAPLSVTRVELTGSTDFSISGVPDVSSTFALNDAFTLTLRYKPSSGQRVQGAIRIFYTLNPTNRPTTGSSGLNLTGVAPDFTLSYLPPPSANATPILSGGTIAFPATAVNETASAGVVITNRGSGPGAVGEIAGTGAAFSLTSLPSPPTTVDAGRDVRFAVKYAPTLIETSTGTVRIEFVDRTVSFSLTGSSTGSVYGYELLQGNAAAGLAKGATVAVPDVAVGDKSTVTVRVRNTGNADGRITAIGVQGAGYVVTDSPFLPVTLTPGSTATVTLTFTPTAPGRYTGRLRVGDDSFDVVSNGLGPNLTYAYVTGPVSTTISNGGSIVFPPATVGQTSTVRFVIANTGTSPAAVNSVSVVATGTTFATTTVPRLPATLGPNDTLEFVVAFAPTATGSLTGTLRVDSQSYSLTGVANQPPAISEYRFTGATGAQQAGQQIAVGLSIAQAYPLTLRGVLTLGFNSDVFANDPAVQFAVGGRTVNFSIPAGQRDAVFSTNQNTIRLQSGTVAGSIVLTPSFQTDGGIVLTPTDPPSLTLPVASAAPQLLSAQITGKTTTGFALLLTGYATSRQVTQIALTFTPTAGENVTTSAITIPADASFNAWYQGTASAAFGSQFTVTVPITIAGDIVNVVNVVDTVKSVSAVISNRIGQSQAVSVNVQ